MSRGTHTKARVDVPVELAELLGARGLDQTEAES